MVPVLPICEIGDKGIFFFFFFFFFMHPWHMEVPGTRDGIQAAPATYTTTAATLDPLTHCTEQEL